MKNTWAITGEIEARRETKTLSKVALNRESGAAGRRVLLQPLLLCVPPILTYIFFFRTTGTVFDATRFSVAVSVRGPLLVSAPWLASELRNSVTEKQSPAPQGLERKKTCPAVAGDGKGG